ncbi:DUF2889 domain-containing protein [Streptomyces iranensis]|uniref:DUF2889 domain-containing protein n=1 Tax=Streptomyces iranensis TaxID=576784 RepID=A0A061A559_9ACTN|nr:DUF2889 domain-containing protein [Streptomyces iranensis]MBP2067718.1 hypothetical protein [Streptomyces iranensis]CDR17970.1 predicted protein [Streptomyces iranensis]
MTSPPRELHPRHGIHEPTWGSPARSPGSIRRTTTIDMLRPAGSDGPLVLAGRGRDLRTAADGTVSVVAEAACHAVVDFAGARVLEELTTEPFRPGLAALIGTRTSSGFRARLNECDPSLTAEHDLLHLLLDDFPVVTLVSGHAVNADRTGPVESGGRPAFRENQCAGFATGGTIMVELRRERKPPVVTGPEALPLTVVNDPLAWHDTAELPPGAMRRARRTDVRPGRGATVDGLFRDSYVLPDGTETVIHEYLLSAVIDTSAATVVSCEAAPRVLPWVECPAAAASAGGLAGRPLSGLRRHVRETFGGTSTCTHLNDMLRGLADVPALLSVLETRPIGLAPSEVTTSSTNG